MTIDGGALRRQSRRRDARSPTVDGFASAAPRSSKARPAARPRASPASWRPRAARRASSRGAAFEADGTVSLAVGTQSNGQGHETTFPQVAADLLGLPIDALPLRPGRHATCCRAATAMAARGRCIWAARRWCWRSTRCSRKAGDRGAPAAGAGRAGRPSPTARFVVQGTERAIAIGDVADAARDAANLPEGLTPGLDGNATNNRDLVTLPQWLPGRGGRDRPGDRRRAARSLHVGR